MTSRDVNLNTVAFTANQVRQAEQEMMKVIAPEVLMARAAFGCAVRLRRFLRSRSVSLMHAKIVGLIGKGNNGGDALYVCADCAKRGARVEVFIVGGTNQVHQAGLLAAMNAGVRVHELESVTGQVDPTRANLLSLLQGADLVLDGLLGIGATGALREPMLSLVNLVNTVDAIRVAIDVPTGVNPTSGELNSTGAAVLATLTVTFGALKTGLLTGPGAACAGRLELVDIGLGPYLVSPAARLVTQGDVDELLAPSQRLSDKYSRGGVGVVAGSTKYPGAALLAVGAARQSGVGMVRYAGPCAGEVVARFPDVVATEKLADAGRAQTWLVGSGLGTDSSARNLLAEALKLDAPLVIDADGLNLLSSDFDPKVLARRANKGWPTFLTPHQGEAARLSGQKQAAKSYDRIAFAQQLADLWSSTCILKGVGTVVATPKGKFVWIDRFGDQSLATAGTGDVLAGFLAGLVAHQVAGLPDQGVEAKSLSRIDLSRVAAVAVGWHGLSGHAAAGRATEPVTATDVLSSMGDV